MKKMASASALAALVLGVLACDEAPPPEPAKKASTCDVSLEALSGEWVKIVPTPRGDALDPRTRIRFFEENGTPKMLATLGTIDKKVLVQNEVRSRDIIYLEERDPATIELYKEKNKNPNDRMQAKMYVRVNDARCKVQLTESYTTYVDGQLVEPASGGAVHYARTDQTYSWENCTDGRSMGYSEKPIDVSKLRPSKDTDPALLRAIPAGQKAYFSVVYADESFKPGCTSTFDLYDEDIRVAQDLTTLVSGKGSKVFLFERTFEPYDTGRYLEVFRYDTCGGEKKLAQVSCGVVKPE